MQRADVQALERLALADYLRRRPRRASEVRRSWPVPFAMAGWATDVLVQRDGRWRYQAHHTSIAGP
jgi:hypothetical protein